MRTARLGSYNITKAIDALARDVSEQMVSGSSRRLEALEDHSAPADPKTEDRGAKPYPRGHINTWGAKWRYLIWISTCQHIGLIDLLLRRSTMRLSSSLMRMIKITTLVKVFTMSKNTYKFLQESFLKAVPNQSRRQMKEKFGDPRCSPTTVPYNWTKIVRQNFIGICEAIYGDS